jgi:hypothetical protein
MESVNICDVKRKGWVNVLAYFRLQYSFLTKPEINTPHNKASKMRAWTTSCTQSGSGYL